MDTIGSESQTAAATFVKKVQVVFQLDEAYYVAHCEMHRAGIITWAELVDVTDESEARVHKWSVAYCTAHRLFDFSSVRFRAVKARDAFVAGLGSRLSVENQ